eukprot:scaffold5373_cov39-Attheya_sp.AAC.1
MEQSFLVSGQLTRSVYDEGAIFVYMDEIKWIRTYFGKVDPRNVQVVCQGGIASVHPKRGGFGDASHL